MRVSCPGRTNICHAFSTTSSSTSGLLWRRRCASPTGPISASGTLIFWAGGRLMTMWRNGPAARATAAASSSACNGCRTSICGPPGVCLPTGRNSTIRQALRFKKRLAEEFREQLTFGAPTNQDEAGLRRLARQIEARRVVVKLFLRHPLHAKLYLLFRSDPTNPTVGYLGSSNLTQSGLSLQGELNVDVLDHDACQKLAAWFEERWNDRWCVDISDELAAIIEESWARERLIPPHHIYVKIAYHLSQEARAGLTEFRVPRDFGNQLLDFQTAAVKIAAHHLNKRGGVIIGDVVGLGKTLMATALARVFEDDHGLETLIICPKNLVPMWEDYRERYRLRARVLSMSRVLGELPDLRRYRLVLIDESHNLRNREGKRYRAIQEYIRENESKCILLSATPYNKTYQDLSSQLRLFVPEADDLGIRPERLLRAIGETEFIRRHQAPIRSLAAFEQSLYPDDWRELMRTCACSAPHFGRWPSLGCSEVSCLEFSGGFALGHGVRGARPSSRGSYRACRTAPRPRGPRRSRAGSSSALGCGALRFRLGYRCRFGVLAVSSGTRGCAPMRLGGVAVLQVALPSLRPNRRLVHARRRVQVFAPARIRAISARRSVQFSAGVALGPPSAACAPAARLCCFPSRCVMWCRAGRDA